MAWKPVTVLCAVVFALLTNAVQAATDPAAAPVQALTAALLQSMKAGPALSMTERYQQLEPVIEQVFALPLVTRFAVGPDWASFTPEQQKAVTAAFTRFTVANYASNFHSFDGQKFEMEDEVVTRGTDKIVRTHVIPAHDSPVSLLYRTREVDGSWRIIDVYSDGVSSLATRRADFAAAIAAGGAAELLAYLNRRSDSLMKSK